MGAFTRPRRGLVLAAPGAFCPGERSERKSTNTLDILVLIDTKGLNEQNKDENREVRPP